MNVANPAGAAKRAAKTAVVRSVRGSGRAPSQRASLTAYEREARRTERLNQFEQVHALDKELVELFQTHRHPFAAASAPIAPEPEAVDTEALYAKAKGEAFSEIPWWRRSARRDARAEATVTAEQQAAAEQARRGRAREDQQRDYDERWAKLVANDPETVIAIVNRAFADNEHPAKVVGVDGSHASIVMTVGSVDELVHESQAQLTPTGKPTTKVRSKTMRNHIYLGVLASGLIATAREAFAVAPGLESVAVVVNRRNDVWRYFTPVLAAQFDRSGLERLMADSDAEATSILGRAESAMMNQKGRTDEVGPLDLSHDPELADEFSGVADELGLTMDPATGGHGPRSGAPVTSK